MDGNLGKLAAVGAGVGLCLIALTAWRLPTSGSPPGLDLRLIAVPPGELTVDPTGAVASARAMQAGDPPARGNLRVENIAGRPLTVRLSALPSDRALAGKLHLQAAANGETIATGTLASLARGPGFRLPARGAENVDLSAWVAAGTRGYRGGILDVTLEFRARPARGRR